MTKLNQPVSNLSVAAINTASPLGHILKVAAPLLDSLLGINKLRNIYLSNNLSGLPKQEFSEKLLNVLGINVIGAQGVTSKIPQEGPCIVVCNHPYGMIEGVIIAKLLTNYRKDTKVMANVGLKIFKEIEEYFIFANPLKPKAAINTSAIKQCFKHINNDGLLVVFPAGRVSFFQSDKQRITDAEWNRLAAQLALKTQAPLLPVFISGENSPAFHNLGRIYYRFRLLMLVRELLKIQKSTISLSAGNLLTSKLLGKFDQTVDVNDIARLQCYLNDERYITPWQDDNQSTQLKAIMPDVDKTKMTNELSNLPSEQHLVDFKNYSVYYGYQQQIPNCVAEITRLREITFRTLNEGSGEPCDTDKFDATYMHLFIYDHKNEEIIGAYRIGQTDLLLKNNDISALYLSQMFNFEPSFINQQQPCLEMGRSFIVEEHQGSYHGLLLLFKGIGVYMAQNPRYRTLYGTVSLSKLYDPRSVAIIDHTMVNNKDGVNANTPFDNKIHPEFTDFINNRTLNIEQVSTLVMGIESDKKDLPILLKQYHKLGAQFHCMGIDSNFNHTPGLLLSVHLPSAPEKLLKLYLGDKKDNYVNYPEAAYTNSLN
ncbi:lysophospholipid acyltransferase family protein [Pseudoalteromonas sp. SWXJZ94C]|uniref:lysophospholipid acyltransferase family protein n=1 Tax=unclassified Pseudoalteromonas TaxID=194690 RepID=UPI001408ED54|nr:MULTISPECIES: GNAT family N-acyltransferase [unclassified Pseudoalteromonas]MBH0058620.1 lysophospholipid acyltransferase family protein [Pseudoalteromonas sp. SWXJZ94C]